LRKDLFRRAFNLAVRWFGLMVLFLVVEKNLCLTLNAAELECAVAVPCYWRHFQYLGGLLQALAEQTVKPVEVVISLSQAEMLSPEELDALERVDWPFRLRILRRQGQHMAGNNRSLAARTCQAPIVCCIDADDIPHRQRIEAVQKAFEMNPDLDMVLTGHAYCPGLSVSCCSSIPWFTESEFKRLNFDLKYLPIVSVRFLRDLKRWESGIHNGAPNFRRSVLDSGIGWSDLKNGEDQEFNFAVMQQSHRAGKKVALIKIPLLHYCNSRSSASDTGR
jgi:hypothetical protein